MTYPSFQPHLRLGFGVYFTSIYVWLKPHPIPFWFWLRQVRIVECNNKSFNSKIADANAWQWVEKISTDKDKLLKGLYSYQSRQESQIEPIRKDLALVKQLIKDKNQELDEEIESLSILTSRRAYS
ncbi:MAG: hypothetical protein SVT56_12385 [Chloroflexota bacterium]|nr:hypothetical protein [Chloroflexota bacterium]